jgi:superfamily I DNA/RNA helicase
LTINYRSASEIVSLANAIFDDAPDLVPGNQAAGRVLAVEVLNEYSEAEWVLREINRTIGGGDFLRAVSDDVRSQHRRLSDFAVLYRSRSAAAVFQKLLAESGLPYQVVGDGSPYDWPDIQAIIALLKAGLEQQNLQLEGYGSAQKRLLEQELATTNQAIPSVLVDKIINILGFQSSRELQQFTGVLVKFKEVKAALEYFDDIADQGFYDSSADAITLLTIHAAKGLEFPQVFLIGAEEGILPSARGDESEEKRLFYVAVSRARERLEITHARNRGGQKAEVSRFVKELPPDVLEHHTDPEMANQVRRIAKRTAKRSQQSLF